jgi:branched-chain amino acid aminotransferase
VSCGGFGGGLRDIPGRAGTHLSPNGGSDPVSRPSTLTPKQIKYTELPNFTEVIAAGTAAALVPIRSITRRTSSLLPAHPRVSVTEGEETITYIPEGNEEPGAICVRLLSELKAIQLGKVEDKFGWRFEVTEADAKAVVAEAGEGNGNGQTVDQLD